MRTGSLTDVGEKREMNQDYLYLSTEPVGRLRNLFLVADGMGGHNAGDFASRFTVEVVVNSIRKSEKQDTIAILLESITAANTALKEFADGHPSMRGMGTTIVAATIEGRQLIVANVGDSRLYVAGEKLRQITRDHSLVQEMVRMGEMDAERARNHPDKNIITRAIGADDKVVPDIFEEILQDGESVIMCTDGLSNMVSDDTILEIMQEDSHPEDKTEKLVSLANENGGKDNITVIIVEL